MPQSYPTDNIFETLYQKIERLEARIKELEENPVPTVPIYDYNNLPDDPVEGQHAILINAPDADTPATGDWAYMIYVNQFDADTCTVPGDGTGESPVFNVYSEAHGITLYTVGGTAAGVDLPRGIYHIFGMMIWDNAMTSAYDRGFWFSGPTFSYVVGAVDLNMENADYLPAGDEAYTHKTSMIFRQADPTFSMIIQLSAQQLSGSDLDIDQAALAVHRIASLP